MRLGPRGRSERPLRSFSASEMEDEEETDDMWARPGSLGWGIVGTGDEACKAVEADSILVWTEARVVGWLAWVVPLVEPNGPPRSHQSRGGPQG